MEIINSKISTNAIDKYVTIMSDNSNWMEENIQRTSVIGFIIFLNTTVFVIWVLSPQTAIIASWVVIFIVYKLRYKLLYLLSIIKEDGDIQKS